MIGPTPIRALLLLPFAMLAACSEVPSPTESGADPQFAKSPAASAMAALGQAIYHDENLSLNRNQSCATCHAAEWGFKGSADNNVAGMYEGSVAGRFGARTPPSAADATQAPVFGWRRGPHGLYIGGNFWDGRATGWRLGSPAAELAMGPFLNPVEQALSDLACVVYRVASSGYGDDYRAVWGREVDAIAFPATTDADCEEEGFTVALSDADRKLAEAEHDRIALAVAAFDASPAVNAFSSKFDQARGNRSRLNAEEQLGLQLFNGKAECSECHPSRGHQPLFTDYCYDNLGTPKNPDNPVYTSEPDFVDLGLGGPGGAAPGEEQWRAVRVPTLRNVAKGPPGEGGKRFMHNGVFTSLKEVVHFYNTRDALPRCAPDAARAVWGVSCWPAPEVDENVNDDELGDLGLTPAEEDAIVAFLKTLSDM